MHRFGFTRLRPGSQFTPIAFGFAPVLCNPPPGPCLGLEVGDELVLMIEELAQSSDQPCDFEGLAFKVGGELRMTVEEQRVEYGDEGGESCSSSSGTILSQAGWTYQPSEKRLRGGTSYWASATATNGDCSGEIHVSFYGRDGQDLSTGSFPASVSVTYVASDQVETCPLTCNGALVGTLSRSDG